LAVFIALPGAVFICALRLARVSFESPEENDLDLPSQNQRLINDAYLPSNSRENARKGCAEKRNAR